MDYEALLIASDRLGLAVKEKPLQAHDGRIHGKRIAIREDLETSTQKACVLAEELGHYHTSSGDILDQSAVLNRKQEQRARLWAYDQYIGLGGIIRAYERGCQSLYETAEYLGVTENFLADAIQKYRKKYGFCIQYSEYIISFVNGVQVGKIINFF